MVQEKQIEPFNLKCLLHWCNRKIIDPFLFIWVFEDLISNLYLAIEVVFSNCYHNYYAPVSVIECLRIGGAEGTESKRASELAHERDLRLVSSFYDSPHRLAIDLKFSKTKLLTHQKVGYEDLIIL